MYSRLKTEQAKLVQKYNTDPLPVEERQLQLLILKPSLLERGGI